MKAAILLVSSHSTIVLLGADRQHLKGMNILLTGILSVSFVLNVPSASSYNHERNVNIISIYRRNSLIGAFFNTSQLEYLVFFFSTEV